MSIFNIVLLIMLICAIILGLYQQSKVHKYNKEIDKENENLKVLQSHLETSIKEKQNTLNTLNDSLNSQKELSQKAFESFFENLENQYSEAEEEHNICLDALNTAYSNQQLKLMGELQEVQSELDKMRATRAAAFQAQAKEKEIQDNKDDYRLNLSEKSLRDIKKLKSIQDELSLPIVVDKIIWSNYYQPIAKTQFPKIIGKATACGVYKITSLVDGSVYVGQAVDIYRRWSDHAKNALGVGSASANKLYKKMREQGLYNFTFEVLEEVPAAQLDEKEKYYISLYDSCTFGMNSTVGNSIK